ncbi:hypothetical protein JD844_019395 [Phrynosoma platyrhinos]|uniref:Lipid-binding serum glycoprotein N-terminal domain-containing protein n=1 Tax=Phrynosoma platyrhinos TaxID=52577 RepID=A0ABQ7SPQ5_PHRPL|nr:hypothetical protein JD844_019395 [Phrynosoma platyrhinos]
MGMDLERSGMGLLLLLVCGWVALSEGASALFMMKLDPKTIEHSKLKVKDIRPPNVTVAYMPNMGTSLSVIVQITISGKSFIGGTMEITVVSNMTTQSQMKLDAAKNIKLEVKECDVQLISCKTNLPSSMLPKIVNKFLDSTLKKVMPNMMCPAAAKVANAMEEEINIISRKHSIGGRGEIQYVISKIPEITSESITVPLDVVLHKKNGEKIEIPRRTEIPSDLPVKKGGITEIIMSANVLDAFMELFKDDFRCDVSNAKIAGKLPRSKKVKAQLRLKEPATHSLGSKKSSMKVHSTVDFIKDPEGGKLLSLDMVQQWDVGFDLKNEKLKIEIGPVRYGTGDAFHRVEALKKYMQNIVSTACVPTVNKALAENQMVLPSMFGATYGESKTWFEKFPNTLMLDVQSNSIDYSTLVGKMEELVRRQP